MAKKKKGAKKPPLSNDAIRWRILNLLYGERVESGTPKRYLWSALKKKVREELKFNASKTTHNLLYLIQNDWIEKESEPYSGPRARTFGTQRELHQISTKAIDLFEEESMFSEHSSMQELVVAGDLNIVQVGPNTYAYEEFQDLQSALLALLQAVVLSEDFSPRQKLRAMADIKAIMASLLHSEPDRTFLNRLRDRIGWLGDFAGISSFVMNVLQRWPF